MKYKYTAMNSKNQKKEGTVDASSQTEAIASLRSKGLIVQDIVETGEKTESIGRWISAATSIQEK